MNLVKHVIPLLTIFGLDDGRETAVSLTHPTPLAAWPQPVPRLPIQGQPVALSKMGEMRLAIKLASMIGSPVKRLTTLERYHRIFLIAFEPHGKIDPVMPITALPLGRAHDDYYRYLAAALQSWRPKGNPEDFAYHANWFSGAEWLAMSCAKEAAAHLEPDEADYYATQLLYSVANPDRRNLEVPME